MNLLFYIALNIVTMFDPIQFEHIILWWTSFDFMVNWNLDLKVLIRLFRDPWARLLADRITYVQGLEFMIISDFSNKLDVQCTHIFLY